MSLNRPDGEPQHQFEFRSSTHAQWNCVGQAPMTCMFWELGPGVCLIFIERKLETNACDPYQAFHFCNIASVEDQLVGTLSSVGNNVKGRPRCNTLDPVAVEAWVKNTAVSTMLPEVASEAQGLLSCLLLASYYKGCLL